MTTRKPSKKEIAKAVEKTKNKAEEYARDPKKAKELLDNAVKKAKSYERNLVVLSHRERFIILSGKDPGRTECEHQ